MPAASSIHRMLRRVASASSSAVGGSAGKARSSASTPGAMRLQRVDPVHQQVEQPVACHALGGRLRQRRLIGHPAEAQQDGGRPGNRSRARASGSAAARAAVATLTARQPFSAANWNAAAIERLVELHIVHGRIMARFRRLGNRERFHTEKREKRRRATKKQK